MFTRHNIPHLNSFVFLLFYCSNFPTLFLYYFALCCRTTCDFNCWNFTCGSFAPLAFIHKHFPLIFSKHWRFCISQNIKIVPSVSLRLCFYSVVISVPVRHQRSDAGVSSRRRCCGFSERTTSTPRLRRWLLANSLATTSTLWGATGRSCWDNM